MAQDKIVFHVKSRDSKTKPKHLRMEGKIPANVFGLHKPSEAVVCDANAFRKLYDEVGDTGLIYVKVDGNKQQPVLIDSVDYTSVGNTILHAALKRVNLTVAVTADVPVELIGENDIPNSIVTQVKQDIEVEALPANLPEKFEIDISTLTEIGQTITLSDLTIDTSKVTFVLGEDVDPETETVVVLQQIEEEKEEESTDATELSTEETASEDQAETDSSEQTDSEGSAKE